MYDKETLCLSRVLTSIKYEPEGARVKSLEVQLKVCSYSTPLTIPLKSPQEPSVKYVLREGDGGRTTLRTEKSLIHLDINYT